MNWTRVAPKERLYKGKGLFRWDVSPGLEHHCGVCATPLHNSRARNSCIGKHVEPCHRFHQQLHFVGKSHECLGCNHSDEMHHARHKEILKIIRRLTIIDKDEVVGSGRKSMPPSSIGKSPQAYVPSVATTPTDESEVAEDMPKLKRSERKKAKKMSGSNASKKRKDVEAFPQQDTNFISEAIHLTVHESKGGVSGSYTYGSLSPATREHSEKIETKFNSVLNSRTPTKLPRPPPHSVVTRRGRLEQKYSTASKNQGIRGTSRKFSPANVSNSDAYDGLDPQIFVRLGIEVVNPHKNSTARKELVSKLIAEIKNDLSVIAQEEAEAKTREVGFWRWAGRAAHQAIMDTRETLDWATGMKKASPGLEPLTEENFEVEGFYEEMETQNDELNPKITDKLINGKPLATLKTINSKVKDLEVETQGPEDVALLTRTTDKSTYEKSEVKKVGLRKDTDLDNEDADTDSDSEDQALATLASFSRARSSDPELRFFGRYR